MATRDFFKAVFNHSRSLNFRFLFALIIIWALVFTGCNSGPVDKGHVEEPLSQPIDEQNNNSTGKEISEIEKEISYFLLQGEVLSTSDVVGSGYPELYYFSEQGTYAYLGSQYGVREEGQLLSQRGQWSLTDNILLLSVLEEKRAYGGELADDLLLGEILIGYQVVHSEEAYQLAYAVSLSEDDLGRPYLLKNNQPLYLLAIPEEDILPLRVLSEEGHGAFEQLTK